QEIIPVGAVFCTEALIQATAYRFVDPDGNPISDGTNANAANQAPICTTVRTTFTEAGPREYVPYAVMPGDLASYTPEKLNLRMNKLGYPGPRYFEDVVVPNAYTFRHGQNYLIASWSGVALSETKFGATH